MNGEGIKLSAAQRAALIGAHRPGKNQSRDVIARKTTCEVLVRLGLAFKGQGERMYYIPSEDRFCGQKFTYYSLTRTGYDLAATLKGVQS